MPSIAGNREYQLLVIIMDPHHAWGFPPFCFLLLLTCVIILMTNILVGLAVADSLEELHVVEMAVCVIFNVPLAAGAILGYTGALVVARGKEIGYAGCYGVHCTGSGL